MACIYRPPVYSLHMKERPLHEPSFLILTALAAEAQHGYANASIASLRLNLLGGTA